MALQKAMVSSKTNEWETPQSFFDELNKEFNFTLDPCSNGNHKCEKFYTIKEDGLKQDWSKDNVFMNPPYGGHTGDWIKKALEESRKGATVVCLIVSSTDRSYWHEYIFPFAKQIRFIRGRLKFGNSKSTAPFASAIVIFSQNEFKERIVYYSRSVNKKIDQIFSTTTPTEKRGKEVNNQSQDSFKVPNPECNSQGKNFSRSESRAEGLGENPSLDNSQLDQIFSDKNINQISPNNYSQHGLNKPDEVVKLNQQSHPQSKSPGVVDNNLEMEKMGNSPADNTPPQNQNQKNKTYVITDVFRIKDNPKNFMKLAFGEKIKDNSEDKNVQ